MYILVIRKNPANNAYERGFMCRNVRQKGNVNYSIKNPLTSPKVSGLNLRFITNSLIHLYFSQNIIPLFHYDE